MKDKSIDRHVTIYARRIGKALHCAQAHLGERAESDEVTRITHEEQAKRLRDAATYLLGDMVASLDMQTTKYRAISQAFVAYFGDRFPLISNYVTPRFMPSISNPQGIGFWFSGPLTALAPNDTEERLFRGKKLQVYQSVYAGEGLVLSYPI